MARPQDLLTDEELRRVATVAYGAPDELDVVIPLSGGSINTSYALRTRDGSSMILRVAPSDATAATGPGWLTPWGLRREVAVIALAPDLHPVLPVTVVHDFERTVLDRDWVIQEVMPGDLLSDVNATLPVDERTVLWTELGAITRRLHSVHGDAFGPPAWGQRFDRWSDLLAHEVHVLIDDAGRFSLPPRLFLRLWRLVEDLAPVLDNGISPHLVHSDLAPAHVFVDRTNEGRYRIAGIIDLEFGRFADPQMERLITSLCWGQTPVEMVPAFFGEYGHAFEDPDDRIRLHVYVAIALGWSATILAWHETRDALPGILGELDDVLNALERFLW